MTMPVPAFKWTGGKRWLVERHADKFPSAEQIKARGGVHREPFVGGGAFALGLMAGKCDVVLTDANQRLIRTYITIRDNCDTLIDRLREMAPRYSEKVYLEQRDELNHGIAGLNEAVAFFVVLAWGFNGLYRVTRNGECNTAFGKPSKPGTIPKLFDEANLRAISAALQGSELWVGDFEEWTDKAKRGDFVFLDPPYEPVSATADFTGYAEGGWRTSRPVSQEQGSLFASQHVVPIGADLYRLAKRCDDLDRRGVQWALTNSDAPSVHEAFKGFNVTKVSAARNGGCKGSTRGTVNELLIRNY